MNLHKIFAGFFFAGYSFLVIYPLVLPVWVAVLALTILFFIIIENEDISYYFAISGVAFALQLAGGMSSPLFVGYIPVIFILHKRGLQLKPWWLILPLLSLFSSQPLIPYLFLYGSVIFIYFVKPKLINKKILNPATQDSSDKVKNNVRIFPEQELPVTIPDKFDESLSANLDILVRMFNPFSVVLLIKKDKTDNMQVHIAESRGEIKQKVAVSVGPLSWFLKNSGILVNNDFNNSSSHLGYYKKEENIQCFMANSIEFLDKVIGILVVDRNKKEPFSERDKEMLSSVAKGLSTLFSFYKHMNASMLEVFRLRSLLTLTERVAGEIKLEEVRRSIFEAIRSSFQDVWSIFLLKEGKEYFITEEDDRRYYHSLKQSIVAAALEKKISLCKTDLSAETKRPILFPEERKFEANSLLFSPFKGDVKGGILLLSKTKDCFDRNQDVMILNLMADIAASSVEKAFLYHLEEEKAVRDGLTEAYNHRFFQEILENKIAEAQRNEEPISLLMIDLDNFKMINDQFGHQNGDMILKSVGSLMKDRIRSSDILARYGGEEFAIILPKTAALEGYKLAENLRNSVESKEFISPDGLKLTVTISIGVAELLKHAHNKRDLIAAADRALYLAKKEGKNCTCVAES
jgi:diguanylate cyclase (GGDEF)-like protein